MMLKKKSWAVFLLSGILALSLTACGGGSGGGGSSPTATDPKPAENKASAPKEEAKPAPAPAPASSYPEKPITVIAPSGAGGGLDIASRTMIKALADTGLVKQSMSVENKPGGGQAVGLAEFVTKDPKNEHKLNVMSPPLIINNLRKEGNSPHSFRDMTPLARLYSDYEVIAVKAESKYQDLKSLMDDIKANPDQVTVVGGSGPGSQDHLNVMFLADAVGIDTKSIKYISYDGGGEAMTALLGDNGDVLTSDTAGLGDFVKAGKVRVLGVSAPERLDGEFKDIPTYKEQGFDVEYYNWRGVFGVKDMSPEVVKYWDETLKALSESEEWKKVGETSGWVPGHLGADEFKAFLEEQEAMFKKILGSLEMLK